jgi:hypothetical protein
MNSVEPRMSDWMCCPGSSEKKKKYRKRAQITAPIRAKNAAAARNTRSGS